MALKVGGGMKKDYLSSTKIKEKPAAAAKCNIDDRIYFGFPITISNFILFIFLTSAN